MNSDTSFCGLGFNLSRDYKTKWPRGRFDPAQMVCYVMVDSSVNTCDDVEDRLQRAGLFSGGQFCFRFSTVWKTYLCMGEENHNLWYVFSKFCQISSFYSILYLILRFTSEETEVRKQVLPFVPACIWTFDVISEINCVFLRRKRRFEHILLYPNIVVISLNRYT